MRIGYVVLFSNCDGHAASFKPKIFYHLIACLKFFPCCKCAHVFYIFLLFKGGYEAIGFEKNEYSIRA